ncbi:MAG: PQQ-binding-like beta-propeller repeat protein [Planctomycetales bacterium]|nr:PQQ-binding-like beta-propeller repeat protein [Planctomycetales bacterium]
MNSSRNRSILLAATLAAVLGRSLTGVTLVRAADWPMFRGPNGNGQTADAAPLHWSAEDNVLWATELPQPSNGSPIVVADRVFVTTSLDELGKHRSLFCYDKASGEQRWVRTVDFGEEMPHHATNPHGSTTPASDGQRVVVWHASAGLYCYDMDGNELWSRDLGEFRHMWGYGSSPIIVDGRVILNTGPGAQPLVLALDATNGNTLWQHEVAQTGNGERRDDEAPMGSWSTPIVAHVAGKDQVIVMHTDHVAAYDPATGEVIWTCDGISHDRGDLAYSSAIVAGDVCFVTGGYKGPAMAIALDGRGNVTDTHRRWRIEENPQNIGTGIFVDGYVYRPNAEAGKGLDCVDPATGEIVWSERTPAAQWGSMVMANGLLYVTDQDGTTLVFRPNPTEYEEVARNPLGESSNSSPAVSDGQIFIRTATHLYCIGEK